MKNPSEQSTRRLWGIIDKRQAWRLSMRGWSLIVFLLTLGFVVFAVCIYPFLAVTARAPAADVLVVEGWINPFAIRAAAQEFRSGHYRRIFTTGGPVVGSGGYINEYNTSANVGADLLKKEGIPASIIQVVPSREMQRDRTYAAAVALRDWFQTNNFHPTAANLATEAPHARRSQLLFQKAMGNKIRVGVVAMQNPDYDPKYWWRYSEAVKDVEEETLGYLYARLFFYSWNAQDPKRARK